MVRANVVATLYDQSQAVMVPGAVESLPLNVQSSVWPLFVSVQVSVNVGPVTPKLAVATVGRVTESTADADTPPEDAPMVTETVPPTALVTIVNVALVNPAGTDTLAGTVTGSPPDSNTTTPPAGAAAMRTTVPVTDWPPTTLEALRERADKAAAEVTLNVGDWLLLAFREAVIDAVPGAAPVTVIVALNAPAGIVMDVCTVATAGLLLDTAIVTAVTVTAFRLTVACTVLPTVTVVALSATVDTVAMVDGDVGELHAVTASIIISDDSHVTSAVARWLIPMPLTPLDLSLISAHDPR